MEEAIVSGDLEAIELLLEEGADANGRTVDNIPYLFISEDKKIIKILLEYGADIDTLDESGYTIKDYHDNIEDLYKQLIVKQPKFTKYRCSMKQQKRNKTRRVKRSQISS